MKLYWQRVVTIGAFALASLLTGCGGGGEAEAPAPADDTAAAKTEAESKTEDASSAALENAPKTEADKLLAKGDAEMEAVNGFYEQAQEAFRKEVNELVKKAQEEAQEGKPMLDMNSPEGQAELEKAQAKIEGYNKDIESHAKKALEFYQQAAKADPKSVAAHLGQFQAYYTLGDQQGIMDSMAKAQEVMREQVATSKPAPEELIQLLWLYGQQNKADEAEAMLKEVQEKYGDDEELQKIATQALQEIADYKNQTPPGTPPVPNGDAATTDEGGESPAPAE